MGWLTVAKRKKTKARACRVTDPSRQPAHWDRVVSVAFLRLLEHTQAEAAKATGICARTLQRWESSPTWAQAKAEATSRWLGGLDGLTMRALRNGLLADDQATARWWASKRIRELGGSAGARSSSAPRSGNYGIFLTPEQLRGMSDEQLDALDAALALGTSGDPGGDPGADPGGEGEAQG